MVGPSVPREPVRVLVVDADRRVRQSLAGLIRVSEGLELDIATGDPAVAMQALESGSPAVVLIDPRLPEAEVGLALLHEIRGRWPELRIVALSAVQDDRLEAIDGPCVVFVSSTAPPEMLVDALRGVRADGG
ncbi:MAG: response regulator transcription factor [Chloroflexi bacterium]|nr:response regulator transcription factor [Chloroflexota bacterium]